MNLELLNKWDTGLFLFLNSFHNEFCDFIMLWISKVAIWFPFYLLVIYLLIKYYRKNSFIIIIFGLLLVFITDQTSYHLFKYLCHRLRPCHEPSLQGLVHIVNGKCGGLYGFLSSHAANTFGFAVYISFFLGRKIKYFTPFMLIWATVVSYSRIYLGVHYPGDVLCGALFGTLCGFLLTIPGKRLIS